MASCTPYHYEIKFDPTIANCNPHMARGPITVTLGREESLQIVKSYMAETLAQSLREPTGNLHHRFVVPGGGYGNLWDWDSFFLCSAIPDAGLDYARGTVLNLVDGILEDGHPSKLASAEGSYTYDQHAYPLLGQFAYLIATRMQDFSWVAPIWEKLCAATQWYETNTRKHERYFTWLSLMGNGIDNNPAVYGRPAFSSAGIDLATWHYREYRALQQLSGKLNMGMESHYGARADQLRDQVQREYWDCVDGSFYNLDVSDDDGKITQQAVTWNTHLKFRSWACLFPLWGKMATAEQAAVVREHIMSEREYLAPCGVRSHSAIEPIYNNVPMGNPSNWQGPVWGLSTFVTGYALAKYGYIDDALEVCFRLIRTYAADITQNGCIHEYYHGDTGQPLTNPGFMSWNLIAARVIDDIRNGIDGTSFDLLDV